QGREGKDVLPIVWQDNYFSLAPGERRRISATYKPAGLGKATPFLHVEGWNISADEVPLASARKQARRR
ncbi:MAG: hypothetical protein M3R67_08750, partial [Acidobacteriota bacterium]|nr:hypothetical protein [Acidobacteriota bacterium]